ncbi:hypothetical protein K469DRAFT_712032 [Zopfia rhizophila CBS 207.26]|uniref:Protein kinase domain-containing protein n=1 Tax=Zopfia rhizophila CBS 207.26 TaxID=1314779 RepID=A0A6A6DWU7_9PEZI|nr:hypothetical protein K469DRAFT_712032 [Zopfia rhizophila CBS 207.26]
MVNIATITKISPDFGKVHYILYDLAACDLRKFLTTSPTANRKERHDSARPQRNDSHNMWPGAFIRESQNLADALDFLHTRLHFDTSESLAHNDIKPENILVFYTDSADKNDKYPVGQWKIADFGLSKIKERRPKDEEQPTGLGASSNLLDVDRARQMSRDTDLTHRQRTTSVSRTIPKRHPGRYTAPEIDEKGKDQMDARSADVWGLGCVLTEVIAYAIDPGLVKELEYVCEQPHFRDRRFYDEETKKVKSQFLDWLSNLSGKSSKKEPTTSKWIADSVSLIKRILVEEPSDRPTAKTIRNELSGIYKSMSPHKGKWLHLLDTTNILTGSSPMPGSGSVSAKSESPTEMEEGFPDDATGQSVPYIQLPESTNEL